MKRQREEIKRKTEENKRRRNGEKKIGEKNLKSMENARKRFV